MSTPATPSPQPPSPPDAPSSAATRHRRAQQRAFIQSEQTAKRLPRPDDPIVARRGKQRPPATKRFETHELTRVTVTVTIAAKAVINASSSQGRLFPQALAELFGEHRDAYGGIYYIDVDAVPKSAHFVVGEDERDPRTGSEPLLLRVAIVHASDFAPYHHTILLNASTLADLHPVTHVPLFTAEKAARELLRLYQQHLRAQPAPNANDLAEGEGEGAPTLRAVEPTELAASDERDQSPE